MARDSAAGRGGYDPHLYAKARPGTGAPVVEKVQVHVGTWVARDLLEIDCDAADFRVSNFFEDPRLWQEHTSLRI